MSEPRIEIRAEPGNIADIRIRVDDHVPANEVWIEQDGVIVARLHGLAVQRPAAATAPEGAKPHPVPRLTFQKPLTVLMKDDFGPDLADADLAVVRNGDLMFRDTSSDLYLSQLRLRVAEDPSLVKQIAVFYLDRKNELHPIAIDRDGVPVWPVGFMTRALEIELAIEAERARDERPAAATAPEECRMHPVPGKTHAYYADAERNGPGCMWCGELPGATATTEPPKESLDLLKARIALRAELGRVVADAAEFFTTNDECGETLDAVARWLIHSGKIPAASPLVPGDGFDVLRQLEVERKACWLTCGPEVRAALDALLSGYEAQKFWIERAKSAAQHRYERMCELLGVPPLENRRGFDGTLSDIVERVAALRTALEAAEADTRRIDWLEVALNGNDDNLFDQFTAANVGGKLPFREAIDAASQGASASGEEGKR